MWKASSARSTCSASRSASEYTATVGMPSSRHVRMIRTAISPRLAIRTRGSATGPPDGPPDGAPILTLLAGASMARACVQALSAPVRCKWPNDLLLGEAKVGGILTEARVTGDRVEHVVMGIGINLGDAPGVDGAGAL